MFTTLSSAEPSFCRKPSCSPGFRSGSRLKIDNFEIPVRSREVLVQNTLETGVALVGLSTVLPVLPGQLEHLEPITMERTRSTLQTRAIQSRKPVDHGYFRLAGPGPVCTRPTGRRSEASTANPELSMITFQPGPAASISTSASAASLHHSMCPASSFRTSEELP